MSSNFRHSLNLVVDWSDLGKTKKEESLAMFGK
jgi:hypothetical protein